ERGAIGLILPLRVPVARDRGTRLPELRLGLNDLLLERRRLLALRRQGELPVDADSNRREDQHAQCARGAAHGVAPPLGTALAAVVVDGSGVAVGVADGTGVAAA